MTWMLLTFMASKLTSVAEYESLDAAIAASAPDGEWTTGRWAIPANAETYRECRSDERTYIAERWDHWLKNEHRRLGAGNEVVVQPTFLDADHRYEWECLAGRLTEWAEAQEARSPEEKMLDDIEGTDL